MAKKMGAKVLEGCEYYNDTEGICRMWKFTDVDIDLRQKYSGIFKNYSGLIRPKVGEHPELCALCHRGIAFSVGAPT